MLSRSEKAKAAWTKRRHEEARVSVMNILLKMNDIDGIVGRTQPTHKMFWGNRVTIPRHKREFLNTETNDLFVIKIHTRPNLNKPGYNVQGMNFTANDVERMEFIVHDVINDRRAFPNGIDH